MFQYVKNMYIRHRLVVNYKSVQKSCLNRGKEWHVNANDSKEKHSVKHVGDTVLPFMTLEALLVCLLRIKIS